jgi:hypothetical protein
MNMENLLYQAQLQCELALIEAIQCHAEMTIIHVDFCGTINACIDGAWVTL